MPMSQLYKGRIYIHHKVIFATFVKMPELRIILTILTNNFNHGYTKRPILENLITALRYALHMDSTIWPSYNQPYNTSFLTSKSSNLK
jgi:hypothetical protein